MPTVNRNSTMSYATESHLYALSQHQTMIVRAERHPIPDVSWCRLACGIIYYITNNTLTFKRQCGTFEFSIPLTQLPPDLKDICLYSFRQDGYRITAWLVALTWGGEATDIKMNTHVYGNGSVQVELHSTYPCVSVTQGTSGTAIMLHPEGKIRVLQRGELIDHTINTNLKYTVDWTKGNMASCRLTDYATSVVAWSGEDLIHIDPLVQPTYKKYLNSDPGIKYLQCTNHYKLALLEDGVVVEQAHNFMNPRPIGKAERLVTVQPGEGALFWVCVKHDGTCNIVGKDGGDRYGCHSYLNKSWTAHGEEEIVATNTEWIKQRVDVKSARKRQ